LQTRTIMRLLKLLNPLRTMLATLALAAGTIAVPATSAFAADVWQSNDDDSLLLDVRSGQWRVGDGVRGYQTDTGVCVDFADLIIALDLPVRLDKKSRRATGWLFEENRTITIDRDQNTVQIMNKTTRLAETDIRDTREGWCVDIKTAATWLNVEITADLSNSLLILKADRKLPFELAEERKARVGNMKPTQPFDLSGLPQIKDPYHLFRVPSVDVVASMGMQRQKLRGATFDAHAELYASGELLGASFDAQLSTDNRLVPKNLRVRAYRSDPQAKLLGPLKATHFAIGDVSAASSALGLQNTAGRGIFVTNRPLQRPENFDRTTFRGVLPDGWDAELYRNQQLIAYVQSRGDGRYEFIDVPLRFGQNRFEVVLYGPQGQIRREIRMIPVGPDSIPPRETYYWAGMQDAGRDLIDFGGLDQINDTAGWRGVIGFERGLDARTSVGGAYSNGLYRGRRRQYLEGSVRRALGPALIELSAASNLQSGYGLRGQALAQFGEALLSAEAAFFENGFQSERFDTGLRRHLALSADYNLKIAGITVPVHAEARHKKRLDGNNFLEANAGISFNISSIAASADIYWEKRFNGSNINAADKVDAQLRLSGRVGRVRLRGEARYGLAQNSGFKESKLTAEWRAGENAEWRAELGYDAPGKRGRIAGAYTKRFDTFALTASLESASDGAVAAGISAALSFGPDPRGGMRVASEKLATMGQAMAIVYRDENADGIRQASEPAEKAVELTAGLNGRGPPTDDTGTSFIDGLTPYQPILIGIDTSSLPDPFVQPANSGVVITPRPGIPLVIELPLVSAGEISGTLQREGGKILSGVDIELLDKNGRLVKTTRSEYDGYFLFESVPYGSYFLRIAALAANVIGINQALTAQAVLARTAPTSDLGIVIANGGPRIAQAGDGIGAK
jgi:hypothetical protein